jgi:hypothetical protein
MPIFAEIRDFSRACLLMCVDVLTAGGQQLAPTLGQGRP